jgi:peptidoglycan/LPS O-acetylase OafA/YrhL
MRTDTRIDSILFGCVLALYGNPVLDTEVVSERKVKWLAFPAAIFLLALLLVSSVIPGGKLLDPVRYTLLGLTLLPIFTAAIRYPEWLPFRFLNWRWVAAVGAISYPLYLVHLSVIDGLKQLPSVPWPIRAAAALALSFGLATLIHVWVEKPSHRLRNRLLKR